MVMHGVAGDWQKTPFAKRCLLSLPGISFETSRKNVWSYGMKRETAKIRRHADSLAKDTFFQKESLDPALKQGFAENMCKIHQFNKPSSPQANKPTSFLPTGWILKLVSTPVRGVTW